MGAFTRKNNSIVNIIMSYVPLFPEPLPEMMDTAEQNAALTGEQVENNRKIAEEAKRRKQVEEMQKIFCDETNKDLLPEGSKVPSQLNMKLRNKVLLFLSLARRHFMN